MTTPKRNDPCPCGSGKKYKHCHEAEARPATRYKTLGLVVGLGALMIGALWFAKVSTAPEAGPANASSTAPMPGNANPGTPGAPQPSGPAPAGKVWSVEHGHWHDAPGQAPSGQAPISIPGQAPAAVPGSPQPPGPAPAGKVWSVEHGHWHDAAPGQSPTTP
jgi:hypothetical protein